MERSEALAPLKPGYGRIKNVTAGALMRGELRRMAVGCGVDFYEEKGWLESGFIFVGIADNIRKFQMHLQRLVTEV